MRFFTDLRLSYSRALTASLRQPTWVVFGLAQPLFYLYLFGPLLKATGAARGLPAGTSSWDVFVPGLLVQLVIFAAAFSGFGLLEEMRSGVLERLQVTPVSRPALLLGRALRDTTVIVVQAALLIGLAVPLGLHLHAGLIPALALLLLLALGLSCLGYGLALQLRSEDALAPVMQGATLPLLLLSGILLPLSLAPGWLDGVAQADPLRHTVDAVRGLTLGTGRVWLGTVITLAMTVLLIAYGARKFNTTEDATTTT